MNAPTRTKIIRAIASSPLWNEPRGSSKKKLAAEAHSKVASKPGQKPPRYAAIMMPGHKVMYRALSPTTGMRYHRTRSEAAGASTATV